MKDIKLIDYKKEIAQLVKYIPWLESKRGQQVSSTYSGTKTQSITLQFPVFDSELLAFIDLVSATDFLDENYMYVYSRYSIKDISDEHRAIDDSKITDADVLCAILSKYVIQGRTKSRMWETGVKEGIFLEVICKMKNLADMWDGPLT